MYASKIAVRLFTYLKKTNKQKKQLCKRDLKSHWLWIGRCLTCLSFELQLEKYKWETLPLNSYLALKREFISEVSLELQSKNSHYILLCLLD